MPQLNFDSNITGKGEYHPDQAETDGATESVRNNLLETTD